jgi:DNA-binding SARP family transcriptional activator
MGGATLRIRLFGELDLRLDDVSLPPLESARARSLLAYLLLHRDAPQPRQRLAFLLWPDSTEPQVRTNLRHLLHNLQRAAPALAPFLEVGTGTLRWREDAAFWLDVAAFEAALERAEDGDADELTALRAAAEHYRGDLLPGCYDEWLSRERDRLRRRYLQALERVAVLLEAHGEQAAAIRYAEELLGHDPFDESTYRLLMRLYAARGDRARALRTYHTCVAVLERELGVEPSTATRELYEALLPTEQGPTGGSQLGRTNAPPLIGRAAEWERLTALWRASERGKAQLVLVSGEPGIGKTRLIEELRAWCTRRGAAAAEARSYAAEGALAYGPVVAWLRSDALKPHLLRSGAAHLTELARLLPELLAEVPGLPRPEALPESNQRTRMFTAVARAILGAGGPLLLIADDLHWADRETLQLLHHLLRAEPEAPLLVAAAARREEMDDRHPLNDLLLGLQVLERATEIELTRLGPEETAALGERLSGRPLDTPDAERLYAETEGNPLFVVEALRAGWKGGHLEREWVSPKVQAVIRSRLSQLTEPTRELAGVAATIGRELTIEVLERASEADSETLVRGLDELWRGRILREHGAHGYDFSHDKIREVAYLALSPARRRHNHLAVAQALERLHARDPGPVSGQIAAHYEQAGVAEQAITWYEAAAEIAQRLYANAETVRLLDRALGLLRTLAETVERNARELAILTTLLTPVASADGWGSRHLEEVQRRALELVRALRVDPPPQLLYSLALASLARGDFAAAQRHAEQLQARGGADHDDALLVISAYVLGIAAFWQGELEAARRHFEAAVAGHRPELRRTHLLRYWLDPQVVCQSRLANTLWFLGEPEAAVRARDAALALADQVGHPDSRAVALVFAALLAVEMADTTQLRAYVSALETRNREDDGPQVHVGIEVLRAYLSVIDGEVECGITRIRSTLDDPRGVEHAPGMRAVLARLLLAAFTAARDPRGRLGAADHLLRLAGAARLWEAEAHRARAECLAELGAPAEEVVAELECAREVARRQRARALEEKAAESLRRYRQAAPHPTLSPRR